MITIDFETQSEIDLLRVGSARYAEDSTTRIICLGYAIDDGPVKVVWPDGCINGGTAWKNKGENFNLPADLAEAIRSGHTVEAHNVAFERMLWQYVCVPQYGWPDIHPDQWADTMAVAHYHSLPGSLDRLAKELGFEGKDPEGARLISKYSKLHLKSAKETIPHEDFIKFTDYCAMDVALEREVSNILGDLPDHEKKVFHLDQLINARGLYIDQEGVKMAVSLVEQRISERVEEFRDLLGFNPSQTAVFLEFLRSNGLPDLPDIGKETLISALEGDLFPKVRRAIELRLETAKTSTSKLDAMLRQVNSDGRARFQTRYHGAATGRWTGSGFQPLNLKRNEDTDPEQLVRDIMTGNLKWLDALYGDALNAISLSSRHWIMAQEGNEITAGDYSNIEAILLAFESDEEWKVQAYRDKKPIYELMGCRIHKLGEEAETLAVQNKAAFKAKYPSERQDGKTGELAFGYQGALNAWLNFDNSGRHSEERIIEMCRAWRKDHPAVVQFWYDAQAAAIECVKTGNPTQARRMSFELVEEGDLKWLSMILPNGKRLWYWQPEIRMRLPAWHKPDEKEECADGSCKCRPTEQLSYKASKEGRWGRVSTYGGKLVENFIQAWAREILVNAMHKINDRWPGCLILTVYDEFVAEYPKGEIDPREFEELALSVDGEGMGGIPLNVECWKGMRYKK